VARPKAETEGAAETVTRVSCRSRASEQMKEPARGADRLQRVLASQACWEFETCRAMSTPTAMTMSRTMIFFTGFLSWRNRIALRDEGGSSYRPFWP
jgi:hypothetical protein